ncbi:MAG TPA: hypothetical protein VNR89_08315 [Roseomonas sp.]|nr:hypothetical protein [Roseomonas sp.]
MLTYARIENGAVAEIIAIPEDGPPLSDRYHPSFVAACFELTADQIESVQVGDLYADGVFSPAPPPAPSADPAAPVITYKADVWRRCTEAEAETLRALINGASAKQQGLWNDSTYLDVADPDFDFVRQAAIGAFGKDRAAELLAPSA